MAKVGGRVGLLGGGGAVQLDMGCIELCWVEVGFEFWIKLSPRELSWDGFAWGWRWIGFCLRF